MPPMYPDTVKVFYEEAKASRDALDGVLKTFRENSTTVLALATGAATFFGFEKSSKGGWFVAALVAYGLAVIAAVRIFRPHPWKMNPAAGLGERLGSAAEPPLTVTKTYFDLATAHQSAFQQNLASIQKIRFWYGWLVVATAAVVLLGGINVTREAPEVPDKPTRVILVEE